MSRLSEILPAKSLIGMLHLRPLPGSPEAERFEATRERLLSDADALVAGGCEALMMENFGDTPFYPGRVPAAVVAAMTALAVEVRRRYPRIPLGINVLRNDGEGALAIAAAVGAQMIRVNVLCGARVTDQGLIQGIAHDLLRLRAQLGAAGVAILADVDVKHSAPLAARPIEDEVEDMIKRGMADGVVVSGRGTGAKVDAAHLAKVRAAAGRTPVLIGSGVSAGSLGEIFAAADYFIVGTSLKTGGVSTAGVDGARVAELVRRRRELAQNDGLLPVKG
jgi:membrane complex biogenesis BtpA family protein